MRAPKHSFPLQTFLDHINFRSACLHKTKPSIKTSTLVKYVSTFLANFDLVHMFASGSVRFLRYHSNSFDYRENMSLYPLSQPTHVSYIGNLTTSLLHLQCNEVI